MGDQRREDTARDHRPEVVQGKDELDPAQDVLGPERYYSALPNQEAATKAVDRVLAGEAPATNLVEMIAGLSGTGRSKVDLAKVAAVAPGDDVLVISDLVAAPRITKLRRALSANPAPSIGSLRAHIGELSTAQVVELLDEETRQTLLSNYAAPVELLPQVLSLDVEFFNSPLLEWFVTKLPPEVVARIFVRGSLSFLTSDLSDALNSIGRKGWLWALAIDRSLAMLNSLASELTPNQPDVVAHLRSVVPQTARGTLTGKPTLDAAELQALVPADDVDIEKVVRAVEEVGRFQKSGLHVLAEPPYSERLIAAATIEQLDVLSMRIGPKGHATKLDWFIRSKRTTAADVASTFASVHANEPSFPTPLLERALQRFPKSSLAELFPTMSEVFHERALKDVVLRRLCVLNADPRNLLALVTQKLEHISRMWSGIISDGVPSTWVQRLGVGAGSDMRLRMLALNIPDRYAAEYIRLHILGDDHDSKAKAPDAISKDATERSSQKRYETEIAKGIQAEDIGHRLRELTDNEVARLRYDSGALSEFLYAVPDRWLLRSLERLSPSLTVVLDAYPQNLADSQLGIYMSSRPGSELIAVMKSAATVRRMAREIDAPFITFAQLLDPDVLAQCLSAEAITWIFQSTDTSYALELLTAPRVARHTARLLSNDHVALLPRTPAGSPLAASIERLAAIADQRATRLRKHVVKPAVKSRDEEEEEEEEETPKPRDRADDKNFSREHVQRRHEELAAALEQPDLASALNLVLVYPVAVGNVLAVCRTRAGEAATYLADPKNEPQILKLRVWVAVSPLKLFPGISLTTVLRTAAGRTWLFETDSADGLFAQVVADPKLQAIVLGSLDRFSEEDSGLATWMSRLPKGSVQTVKERETVERMFEATSNDVAARLLFELRFGSAMAKSFTKVELQRLWGILERVPDAHIEMGSVTSFSEDPNLGYSGLYGNGSKSITLKDGKGGKPGLMQDQGETSYFDLKLQMTKEELVAAYGYTDAQLTKLVAEKQVIVTDTAKGRRYHIAPQTGVKELDSTVLHEIGHAVDDMLGGNTELIYGLAGWTRYGENDFDAFASDLGGWDKVAPADKERISAAWNMHMNSQRSELYSGLHSFVPKDHPALDKKKYAGVGIVELAQRTEGVDFDGAPTNGKLTKVSNKYQTYFRLPAKTRHAAPSAYAMTSPGEYFAECYAEYYRLYTGPGTEAKKGGRLAGWIKQWFDANIDNLAHNPSRKD